MNRFEAVLYRNVIEGIYAERKLNGDPDILADDDPKFLKAVIRQGKNAARLLAERGRQDLVEEARDYATRTQKTD